MGKVSEFPKAILTEMGAGFGNQIAIYAIAKRLSIEKNIPLYLDTLWFDSFPKYMAPRNFGLDKFKISAKIASKKQIKRYLYKTRFRYLNKIFRKFRLFEKKVYYQHIDFDNLNELLLLPDDVYLRSSCGKDYYDDIRGLLIKEFQLKDMYKGKIKELLLEVGNCESVSIHVRRGDLLKIKNAHVLPLGYYKKSVGVIIEKLKNPKFYIFGDDIEWCKNNFDWIENKVFVSGNIVEQDFELMKNCKHNVIANSSFSWWAAYLNDNPKKIVIAPRIFTMFPGKNFDISEKIDDNIPKGWMWL